MTERTYPYSTITLGRWVITHCRQGDGAPIVDSCSAWSADGWQAGGIAIRPPRGPGRALVIARIGKRGPVFTAAHRNPILGWLFRMRP